MSEGKSSLWRRLFPSGPSTRLRAVLSAADGRLKPEATIELLA
jgi:hypothetical protein